MTVLALAATKGGTGKSVLALNIAVLADGGRCQVLLVNADPHGGVANWRRLRQAQRPVVASTSAERTVADLVKAGRREGADLIVIDTPAEVPAAGSVTRAAIELADFVLVPVRASAMDLLGVRPTVMAATDAGRRCALVITQLPGRSSARFEEASAAAARLEVGVCPHVISHRVVWGDAADTGLGVAEFDPTGRASEELIDVWNWLRVQIDGA